eukprot:357995-Chlamydomonas_euryale.AAC.3
MFALPLYVAGESVAFCLQGSYCSLCQYEDVQTPEHRITCASLQRNVPARHFGDSNAESLDQDLSSEGSVDLGA